MARRWATCDQPIINAILDDRCSDASDELEAELLYDSDDDREYVAVPFILVNIFFLCD